MIDAPSDQLARQRELFMQRQSMPEVQNAGQPNETGILFYSILSFLICSILFDFLFHSTLFSILFFFHSTLFSIIFYIILFFYPILFYFILFYSKRFFSFLVDSI